jgi:hypothetical protein
MRYTSTSKLFASLHLRLAGINCFVRLESQYNAPDGKVYITAGQMHPNYSLADEPRASSTKSTAA